jgi:hypothetical protein
MKGKKDKEEVRTTSVMNRRDFYACRVYHMQRLKLSARFVGVQQASVPCIEQHFFEEPRLEHEHHVQAVQRRQGGILPALPDANRRGERNREKKMSEDKLQRCTYRLGEQLSDGTAVPVDNHKYTFSYALAS